MSAGGPVRVLVVDDSALFRRALEATLGREPGIEVVGGAGDGREALDEVRRLRPDVVLMDVLMPRLDGLQATRRIMAERPTPILLMTAQEDDADAEGAEADLGLRALEIGALDLVRKSSLRDEAAALADRLRVLAGVPVISHPLGRRPTARGERPEAGSGSGERPTNFYRRARSIVALVASTGGPNALRTILAGLPPDLPAAVVIVQHIDGAFQESLVRWLDEESPLEVASPRPDQELWSGAVYVAPAGRQAEVTARRRLALVEEPGAVGGHCPSGDRLLASAAEAYRDRAVGVVLTGMGTDGAAGLLRVREEGGQTIAQDEATSVIYGMPRAAAELGGAGRVLPLDAIAEAIAHAVRSLG